MAMNEKLILDVQNLTTTFKTDYGNIVAVDNISYELREKEILGIVGESGSGKTVSNMSIMRLYDDNVNAVVQGKAFFHGKNLLALSKKEMRTIRGSNIAMIFQNPMSSLNPFLTIGKQLVETVLLHTPMSKKDAFDYSIEMLRKVHIPDPEHRIKQYPHQFSGGMRQRVMIAIALCCEPEILIADEPTTALDVTVQAQILDLIEELMEKLNTAVIFITHDMGVVARLCQKVCVMYAGKVVEYAPVEDIFHRPIHPYTQGLLQSIPHITKYQKDMLQSIPGNPPNLLDLPKGCSFAPRCEFADAQCHEHIPEETVTHAKQDKNSEQRYRCFHPLQDYTLNNKEKEHHG